MRIFLLFSAFFLFCNTTVFAQASYVDKPNVIFIVLDDLNDHVGFLNGHPDAETPNLDRLAKRGMIFTNAFAQVAQCAPSRASMMSGKGPDYTQVFTTGQYIKDDFRGNFTAAKGNETIFTLPEVLKDVGGYFTIQDNKIFHGRSQNVNTDVDLDFLTADFCNRSKSWNRAVNLLGVTAPKPTTANEYGAVGIDWGAYPDSLESKTYDHTAVDSALVLLEDYILHPDEYCDRPLFLALGIFRPHLPLFVPEKYWPANYRPDLYEFPYEIPYNNPSNAFPPNGTTLSPQTRPVDEDLMDMPPIGVNGTNMNGIPGFFSGLPDSLMPSPPAIASGISVATRDSIISWSARTSTTQAYLAGVKFADAQLGRFIDALEENPDIYNNTVIIIVSDHGFSLGEKNHWKKQGLWDTDLRIPMVIIDPRHGGGEVCHAPVSLVDIFPTILELTNTEEPTFPDGSRYTDGCSMVALLDNPDTAWNRPILGGTKWSNAFVPDAGCFNQYSVRDDRFHYIRYYSNGGSPCDITTSVAEEELYEIGRLKETDPHEWYNLANDPSFAPVKEYMSQWLPDSNLSWEKVGFVDIVSTAMDCETSLTDSIQFLAVLHNEAGEIIPSTDWTFQWIAPELGSTFGNSFKLVPGSLSSIPEVFELNLKATSPEGYILVDHLSVVLDAAVSASVAYDTLTSGSTIAINNISYNGEVTGQQWDFGDGYITNDPYPAPHSYSIPGSYPVSVEVFYGNGGSCSISETFVVEVEAADFGSACTAPSMFTTEYATNSKAKVNWIAPYNAVSYQLEYRKVDAFTLEGTPSPSTATRVFNGLDEHEEYWMRVKSVCTSSTSDWSYGYRFTTAACDPPRDIYVCRDSLNHGQISWKEPIPGLNDAEFRYYTFGTTDTFTTAFFDVTSGIINDLLAPMPIYCRMRSICPDENGNPTILGGSSTRIVFDNCDSVISNPPDGLENIEGFHSIAIQPNPASSIVLLQGEQAVSGNSVIKILDTKGSLVATERLAVGNTAPWVHEMDVSRLASGIYHIVLQQTASKGFYGKLVIE